MNSLLKWSTAAVAVGVGVSYGLGRFRTGRRRLKRILGRVEGVADLTRATLERAEAALHAVRTAL
jgi:membrane protein DedA with SNARE-associated domain